MRKRLAATIMCLSTSFSTAPAFAGAIAALPAHFGLGVKSAQNELYWMQNTGVPWDYRYAYFNPGWTTWSSPAGQVAASYAAQSASIHAIPVLTWYELGGEWWTSYWSYLASPTAMNQYFADFALLMSKIASAGPQPAIVHVEPDLWGFMQQAYGDDPQWVPVAVASSGFAGLGGFANNAIGFAQALVAIRDSRAANVVLAWHASIWGPNNGYDPTNPNLASYQTPQATGGRLATFYKALHANFDMMFHDAWDADAAYNVLVRGRSVTTSWWNDAAFANYLQYIDVIHQATGLSSMLWQLPIGNTIYRSCNDAPYHYQGNVAQYFLAPPGGAAHLANYAAHGVIGLLFGGGQSTSTDQLDYANDSVTNPPAIDGNIFVAAYPDDDGGFLRTAAAAYYASPVALSRNHKAER